MGVAISTIFSLILSSLVAHIGEVVLSMKLLHIQDLRTLTPLPLYGELPILEDGKRITTKSDRLLQSSESLRTKINFNTKADGKCISITSSRYRGGPNQIICIQNFRVYYIFPGKGRTY